MTGYGAGEATFDGGRVRAELRAVNHRFLDLRLRVPPTLSPLAQELEERLRAGLVRGRVEASLRALGGSLSDIRLDMGRARSLLAQLGELRDEFASDAPIPLSVLGAVPDLFGATRDLDLETIRPPLESALDGALGALDAMRLREGEALARDLEEHLLEARTIVERLASAAPHQLEAHHARLRDRLARLLEGTGLEPDGGRLEEELARLAERSDVSEELVRLRSHCEHFSELLRGEGPHGRKLDFLLQELAREANTLGAKTPDPGLIRDVIELKATLEKMREQTQNVL
ncbi:MAG: YicC family protein [Myxococcales bacterium]|nr:YicC family protein [Myxococcales bacterium]